MEQRQGRQEPVRTPAAAIIIKSSAISHAAPPRTKPLCTNFLKRRTSEQLSGGAPESRYQAVRT